MRSSLGEVLDLENQAKTHSAKLAQPLAAQAQGIYTEIKRVKRFKELKRKKRIQSDLGVARRAKQRGVRCFCSRSLRRRLTLVECRTDPSSRPPVKCQSATLRVERPSLETVRTS